MQPARLPENERERLAVLRAYEILDTPPEEAIDEMTKLAGAVCGAPVALTTFIEEQRQWFKSAIGTDQVDAPREFSFCQYALLQEDVFEVSDAAQDPRFVDSPIVANAPHIRFYAGQPLIAPGGEAIGTLCVLGVEPKHLTQEQRDSLRVLGRQVMQQLELRRALDQLARAHQSALEFGELKDNFVRIASHDLKNPLMVIMGAASMLKERLKQGAIVGEMETKLAPMVHDTSRKMQGIIEDFLDFRAASDGKLKLRRGAVDLNALAAEIAEGQGAYAKGKGIELVVEAGEIPPLQADAGRLRQVMTNLVGNAVKFSPPSTTITLRTRLDGGSVFFEVADQGPGLRDEDLVKLFTCYAKLSNKPTGGESSSGIGLYICKQMIEAHDGQIGAKNGAAGGAVFWFSVPREEAAA